MKRYMWSRGAVCVVLCATLLPAARADAQETRDDVHKVYREMRTMARVLSEVLDRHDLLDGPRGMIGASPFDTEVKSHYVPTVGVTFNVSVRFPIVEPETSPEEEAVEEVDPNEDLWDKFSRGRRGNRDDGGRGERGDRPGPPPPPDGGGRLGHPGPPPRQDEPRRGNDEQFGRQAVEWVFNRTEERYDAGRVETLKRAIVETLAEYGHRMDDLADEERIMVIVDAPKNRYKSMRFGPSSLSDRGRGAVGPAPGGGGVTLIRPQGGAEPMVFDMDGFGDLPWMRDHWLISFQKSELTSGSTPESLSATLRDIRY